MAHGERACSNRFGEARKTILPTTMSITHFFLDMGRGKCSDSERYVILVKLFKFFLISITLLKTTFTSTGYTLSSV